MDKQGELCEISRPISCSPRLISPVPQCDISPHAGNPACFHIPFEGTMSLSIGYSCRFDDDLSNNPQQQFSYGFLARDRKWAVTENISFSINIDILNMVQMSQPIQRLVSITNSHLEGEPIKIEIIPKQLQPQHRFGNRIYLEISSILGTSPPRLPGINSHPFRLIFDIDSMPGPEKRGFIEKYGSVLFTTIFCICALLGGIIIFLIYRRSQSKEKLH